MHRTQAYVDTSVFGGVLDDEFSDASAAFFAQVQRGRYVVLISEITLMELSKAPDEVQKVLAGLAPAQVVKVPQSLEDEAVELAAAYIAAGILGKASHDDAAHVAVATVARADLILSWNFRHIVNYERINAFNGLNSLNGYPQIAIHSPLEMRHDDEDQNV